MSLARLILRSLTFHWRTGIVVVFGLSVATAVITGSLVIGDSVTGSLRETALSRLGRIDYALVAPGYFREQLSDDLLSTPSVSEVVERVSPMILARGAARRPETGAVVPNVTVLGVDDGFWSYHDGGEAPGLSGRECALNAALAQDLGAQVGDAVLVAAHRQSAVASDTLFARRQRKDTVPSLRLRVKAIWGGGGVRDFRLDAQSAVPRNVFVSREWLAAGLRKEGLCNVLLVASRPQARDQAGEALAAGLAESCTLADHGLKLTRNTRRGYLSLTSEGTLLNDSQVEAARRAAQDCGARSALTSVYLATSIRKVGKPPAPELAYAVIAGVEPLEEFAFRSRAGQALGPESIWLNSWAAEDLGARSGPLQLDYLVPSRDGTYPKAIIIRELAGVVELSGPAADPGLVPDFEGITDAERVDDWDPPFPVDLRRITERDEEYWDKYRATPKAFVSLDTVREMWQSAPEGENADWVTSVRVARPEGTSLAALEGSFTAAILKRLPPGQSGLAFRPVREQALAASRGASDFGQLFLGLSMFLVFSGAGLAGMLLRLSVDGRASEAGIMLACGCESKLVRRALSAEGLALTLAGTLLGVPAGVVYAAGMISALSSWWRGAMGATSALWLHVSVGSLAIGAASGLAVGLLAVVWSTRRLSRREPLELLGGWQAMEVSPARPPRGLATGLVLIPVTIAVALGVLSIGTEAVAPQTAFFAIGSALLVAGLGASRLVLARSLLRKPASRSLGRLSLRNAAASSGRSLLVIGLLAAATFVVVAVAANTRDLAGVDLSRKASGTGGFALQAISSAPLSFDLGTPAGRANLGFPPEDEAAFEGAQVISFLASPGEDISCLNLARPSQPRLLGVPQKMIERGGFSLVRLADAPEVPAWGLLEWPQEDGAIPTFGDADSVRWNLHSGLGETYAMPGPDGQAIEVRFVGLLPGSIFASELLVSEERFRGLYPSVTAPSYFLIATPPGREKQVAEALRRNLGELGMQVRTTREVLSEFMQVQNTYLSMFLALGGLGLLLGTVGLVTVLLRSALERRRELALMLATGFGRPKLARLLLIENGGLLLAGLLCGAATALVAVAPQLASAESRVNWGALGVVLAAVLLVGLVTCVVAVHSTVRGSLIPALRQE